MNCPLSLSRPAEGLIADIFLPFSDMGLTCRYALAKNELEIELYFLRKRGKAIFDRLLEDRVAIESHCGGKLDWNDGAKQSITTRKSNVSIKDPIDWLETARVDGKDARTFPRSVFSSAGDADQVPSKKKERTQAATDGVLGLAFIAISLKRRARRWNNTIATELEQLPIGVKSWCFLEASVSQAQNQLRVALFFAGPVAKSFFDQMSAQKAEVEQEMGHALDGFRKTATSNHVFHYPSPNLPNSPDHWSEDFQWFRETLTQFDQVFRDRIASLK